MVFSVGKMMGRLPGKFLFCLILYGAGFITAVYFLSPSPASAADQSRTAETGLCLQQTQTANAGVDTKVWIEKIRTGVDTTIHFAEENAVRVADLIRSRMAQNSDSGSQAVLK